MVVEPQRGRRVGYVTPSEAKKMGLYQGSQQGESEE